MAHLVIVVVIFVAGGFALYLGVSGALVWAAHRATSGAANRTVRKIFLTLSVVVLALLPWSSGIHMMALCTVAGGVETARPVGDIEGLVIDPDQTEGCGATCRFVLSRGYAFVELEVQPAAGLDPIAEHGTRYVRFFIGDAGSGECLDGPDAHGRCLLQQPIGALSAPYRLTMSDYLRPVGLDIRMRRFKLLDRRTGDVFGSMTWYQQGSTGLLYMLNSSVGIPLTCPVGNAPEDSLGPLLERFPPATQKAASASP
jgi:hypothetical protein